MIEGMRNVLWNDPSKTDENTADLYRAFKMLLEVPSIQSSLDDIEKEVVNNFMYTKYNKYHNYICVICINFRLRKN